MSRFKGPTENFVSTTLNGSINDSIDSIVLNDASKLQYPGYIVIDREDGNGNSTPNSREFVSYTGITANTLTGCTRGADSSTARSHSDGALVEATFTAGMWEELITGTAGTTESQTLTNKTLTAPVINGAITGDAIATGATINTGTANDDIVTSKAIADSNIVITDKNQTLTSKTLTTPVINGAFTGTATPPLTFYGSNFVAPEGFLINGKIVPSVASNNLTVALKGLDGNDPSATNPIYVRIGDTIRSITAALSVTKNAGTNWFNSGAASLATKEIDYFVYLGYNATDGVVVGFSRIPYATLYSDFSSTATNEKYCGISTIANAAAGDSYVNIGRFAATLSAGAGYTWTVPTFTTQNLIQRPIFKTRKLSFIVTGSELGTYFIEDSQVSIRFAAILAYAAATYTDANKTFTFPITYDAPPTINTFVIHSAFDSEANFPATASANVDGWFDLFMYGGTYLSAITTPRIRNTTNLFASGKYYGVYVYVNGTI